MGEMKALTNVQKCSFEEFCRDLYNRNLIELIFMINSRNCFD